MEWLIAHWGECLLGFMIAEKIVKLTPWKYDDILFDIIFTSIKDAVTGGKKDA
jgi:hypothetical protein